MDPGHTIHVETRHMSYNKGFRNTGRCKHQPAALQKVEKEAVCIIPASMHLSTHVQAAQGYKNVHQNVITREHRGLNLPDSDCRNAKFMNKYKERGKRMLDNSHSWSKKHLLSLSVGLQVRNI